MSELPEELFIEMLAWLPVKSLLRFRCVSKSVCAFIDSPQFIVSHLYKSSHRNLIFDSGESFHVCDVNLDLEQDIIRLEKPYSFSCPQKVVTGYCNGLILLSTLPCYDSTFRLHSLWNPSTRKYIEVPVKPFVSPLGWGLGYDDCIDEYKVIFLVPVPEFVDREIVFEFRVWIYGLKSNIWRRGPRDFPHYGYRHYTTDFRGIGQFADGVLHFLCTDRRQTEIVAFDVRIETFSIVPQPVCSISSVEGVETKLHVLEERLCISYLSRDSPLQADLYMRKKDGVDMFTWTKLFSVTEPFFRDIAEVNVLGYSKRGDKILLNLGMHTVSYDLKEKSFAKIEIEKAHTWYHPILCRESLVPLGGVHNCFASSKLSFFYKLTIDGGNENNYLYADFLS